MNQKLISIQTLENEAQRAFDWLNSLGLRVERTRYNQYKKLLHRLAEPFNGEDIYILKASPLRDEFHTAYLELYELIEIHRGLSSLKQDSTLLQRIKDIAGGPVSMHNERTQTSSNHPRNISFELHISSLLCSSGISIELSSNADIRFTLLNKDVFVECKRPQADHQINSRIKDGLSQLSKRYSSESSNSHEARGILGISISKLSNSVLFEKIGKLAEPVVVASSKSELSQYIRTRCELFASKYKQKWGLPQDSRTIAMLVSYTCIAALPNKGINLYSIFPANINYVFHTGPLKGEDKKLLGEFQKHLSQGASSWANIAGIAI